MVLSILDLNQKNRGPRRTFFLGRCARRKLEELEELEESRFRRTVSVAENVTDLWPDVKCWMKDFGLLCFVWEPGNIGTTLIYSQFFGDLFFEMMRNQGILGVPDFQRTLQWFLGRGSHQVVFS